MSQQVEEMTPATVNTLSESIAHALAHHPALKASLERWKIALDEVPQVTALPDPRITVGEYVDEIETRNGPMEWRVAFHQPLRWPRERDLAGQHALTLAEQAREDVLQTRLTVERDVKEAWYEYVYLARSLGVTQVHRETLATWEAIERTRHQTGETSDVSLLRLAVDVGRLDDEVARLVALQKPLRASLNIALSRPIGAPLEIEDPAWPGEVILDDGMIESDRMITSPRLRTLQYAEEAARLRIDLAEEDFRPDLSFGIEHVGIGSTSAAGVSGSGDDALAVTFGWTIPVRSKRDAAKEQAIAAWKLAEAEFENSLQILKADLEMALYQFRDADRRWNLHQGELLPQAQLAIDVVWVEYQGGRVEFSDLVDAEKLHFELELSAARARTDRAKALARIKGLTGVGLQEVETP